MGNTHPNTAVVLPSDVLSRKRITRQRFMGQLSVGAGFVLYEELYKHPILGVVITNEPKKLVIYTTFLAPVKDQAKTDVGKLVIIDDLQGLLIDQNTLAVTDDFRKNTFRRAFIFTELRDRVVYEIL